MNETEYIKQALLRECVNSFINSVNELDRFDTILEQQTSILTWGQAVIAALAIQNSDVIIRPFTKEEDPDLFTEADFNGV
jgi:hypothetical protein